MRMGDGAHFRTENSTRVYSGQVDRRNGLKAVTKMRFASLGAFMKRSTLMKIQHFLRLL